MGKYITAILLLCTVNFTSITGQKAEPNLQSVVASLTRNSTFIQDTVGDWFIYDYDSSNIPTRDIEDGGNDLFDTGNQVRYFENEKDSLQEYAIYNQTTTYANSIFYTLARQPFMALSFITNSNATGNTFGISVDGNLGADGAGNVATLNGFIYHDQARGSYQLINYFGTGDPTIGELYFVIDNTEVWNSSISFNFELNDFSPSTFAGSTSVCVVGSPRNILMGYILLAKSDQGPFSEDVIENVMSNILYSLFGAKQGQPLRVPLFSNEIESSNSLGIIDQFYNYMYDGQGSNIQNGGMNMFDNGNRIKFYQDENIPEVDAIYNRLKRYSNSEFVTSSAKHPFFGLVWISDKDIDHTYTLQVYGRIGQGNSQVSVLSGNIGYGNLFTRYHVWSSTGEVTPSVYQIFFVTENSLLWNSSTDYNFKLENYELNALISNTSVRLSGQPSNVIMGYMLLSRPNGGIIVGTEISSLLDNIMIALDQRSCENDVCLDFNKIVNNIFSVTPNIRDVVPAWFNYEYPRGDITSLLDGGNDIFDTGNEIYFYEMGQTRTLATYNVRYTNQRDYIFESNAWHPFIALMLIENPRMGMKDFIINVEGNLGADGLGSIAVTNGSLNLGNFNASFHKWMVYGANDPSVCEVYFMIYNSQEWNSVPPQTFTLDSYSTNTDVSNTRVRVSGSTQNVLFGYMLLRGSAISDDTVKKALRLIIFSLQSEGNQSTLHYFTSDSDVTPSTIPLVIATTEVQTTTILVPTKASLMLDKIVLNMTANPRLVPDSVSDWYNYRYDSINTPQIQIADGGQDLFDNGNEVRYYENQNRTEFAIYNRSRRFSNSEFTTVAVQPFMALSWISNNTNEKNNYTIEVSGNLGADGNGNVLISSGHVFYNNARASYHVIQYVATGDPTIAELYFVIENQDIWNSTPNSYDFRLVTNSLNTIEADTIVRLSGNPNNVLMAYMLLSRSNQNPFENNLIENILNNVLAVLFGPQEEVQQVVQFLTQLQTINPNNTVGNLIGYVYNREEIYLKNGNDLFYIGDWVNFYENENNHEKPLPFNSLARFSNSEFLSSTAGYPFYALAWVSDSDNNPTYTLQIRGKLGIRNVQISTKQGSVEYGNSFARFFVQTFYGQTNDSSTTGLYFIIENRVLWNSSGEYVFQMVNFSKNSSILNSSVELSGNPKNVLMGYVLLSARNGVISSSQVFSFLDDIMIALNQRQCINPICVDFDKIVDDIFSFTNQIRNVVPNFYRYAYDNPRNNSIIDGLNDVFDNGNMLFFDDGAQQQFVLYNQKYKIHRDLIFVSNQWHPFMALMFIDNPRNQNKSFSIQVKGGLGADGFGDVELTNGSLTSGDFVARFYKGIVWNAVDPSVCEVYFLISNKKLWGSVEPDAFQMLSYSRDSNTQNSLVTVSGRPQNVLFGYMLLSSFDGGYISDFVVDSTIRLIISSIQPEDLRTPLDSITQQFLSITPFHLIDPQSTSQTSSTRRNTTTIQSISATLLQTDRPRSNAIGKSTEVESITLESINEETTSDTVKLKSRFYGIVLIMLCKNMLQYI